jgi:hypothetical protein
MQIRIFQLTFIVMKDYVEDVCVLRTEHNFMGSFPKIIFLWIWPRHILFLLKASLTLSFGLFAVIQTIIFWQKIILFESAKAMNWKNLNILVKKCVSVGCVIIMANKLFLRLVLVRLILLKWSYIDCDWNQSVHPGIFVCMQHLHKCMHQCLGDRGQVVMIKGFFFPSKIGKDWLVIKKYRQV